MPNKQFISQQQLLLALLLCAVIVLSFLQRIDAMYYWQSNPQQFLAQQEPLPANLDGYYYLQIAKELQRGDYTTTDQKRAWPEQIQRSPVPPLLSVIVATTARISKKSINQVAVFVPPALGILLAIPLFLFAFRLGGALAGLAATMIGTMAPIYASRTSLAVLDTDCMNATLSLVCAYFFMLFALENERKRYLFLAAGCLCALLFYLWWDQAPAAAMALAFSPLCIGLLFFYRPPKREGLIFLAGSSIILVLFLMWSGWHKPIQFFLSIFHYFSYISLQAPETYPNIGRFITEQDALPLRQLVQGTALFLPVFMLSIFGFGVLLKNKKREVIFLLPFFCVGLLSFLAMRFSIFLGPIIALGFGIALSRIYSYLNTSKAVLGAAIGLILFLGWQSFHSSPIRTSYYDGRIIAGMREIPAITPKNAVIWSWWDDGHPLIYWGERATVNDGMVHSSKRTYYTALPLTSDNERFAANFMQFYAARGIPGIDAFFDAVANNNINEKKLLQDLLSNGPEQATAILSRLTFKPGNTLPDNLLEYLYPASAPPIYIFLDKRMLSQAQFIYWYGTWDTQKQTGTPTLPVITLENIPFDTTGHPHATSFSVNFADGTFTAPTLLKKPVPLQQIILTNDIQSQQLQFATGKATPERTPLFEKTNPYDFLLSQDGYYDLDLSPQARRGMLLDQKQAKTIIHRMFWRKNAIDHTYFQLTRQKLPFYQIWEVHGDQTKSRE